MFCRKCGKENADAAKFCSGCGNVIATVAAVENATYIGSGNSHEITFGKSIAICFAKFFDFKGRASRPEYWWFYLFTILISWGAMLVDKTEILSGLVNLVLCIPIFSAGARRLHDTNRSGWWQLLYVTIIGIIPLLIWTASKGSDQENQYGNPP